MTAGYVNSNNNFGRPPNPVSRNNPFNLKRARWYIDGEAVTATAAQLNATGAGDVPFTFTNTFFWANGGDDVFNPGTNLNQPFGTLAKCVAEAKLLIAAGSPGTVFVEIIGLGYGVDESNIDLTSFNNSNGIYINAPGWKLNPPTGDAFTVDLSGGPVDPDGGSYINVLLDSITVESGAKALNLINVTAGHRNVTRFTLAGATYGDVYLNVACEYYTTIIAGFLTANQAGTNVVTQYGIGGQSQQTRLNLEGMLFGGGLGAIHGPMQATNAWRYPMRQRVFLTGDITLNSSNSGYLYINATTNNYTITLPDTAGQDYPFVLGYEITCLNLSTGSIVFAPSGSATLVGSTVINQAAQRINVTLTDTNKWEADAPAALFNPNNVIYVASNGNDSFTGTNSHEPISSLQLAIDKIDAMSDHSGIIQFLDPATYTGPFNIPGRGVIYFNGPLANIEFDDPILSAINIPDTGFNNITVFNMGGINNYAGGKIIDLRGAMSNCFMFTTINQGNIYTEGGFVGKMVALLGSTLEVAAGSQCALMVVNDIFVTATVDGDLYVDSPICNSSTFTVNTGGRLFVDIVNPQSSSIVNAGGLIQGTFGNATYNDHIFEGSITTNNILLDVVSGAPASGYVMTFDGVNTVKLQPPVGGGLNFVDISGTTQAAAANTAYVSNNALQTTVTLPASPSFGDTVRLYGVGAGGWVLQANAGQTIVYGSSSSTSGGSWTSAAGTDCMECTAMSDGVTWVINWATSAGLTPA